MSGRQGAGAATAASAASAAAAAQANDLFDDGNAEASGSRSRQVSGAASANPQEQQDPGLDEDEEEEAEDQDAEAAGDPMLPEETASAQLEGHLYESESPSDSGTDSLTWISWFCSLPGHEYFAEVSEDFIEDDFNLTGLNALVPFYKEALEMILDVEPQEDSLKIPDVSIVESSAELLYGLIHQRYILTRQGLQQMVEKFERGHFGFCPRVFCHSHPVLPCGRSDLPGLDTVKLFCPNCIDNYSPPSSRFHGVDGAFFGTTFPHLLFQTYRELAPSPIAPPGTNFASLNTQTQAQGPAASQGQRSNGAEREREKEGSAAPSDAPMQSVSSDGTQPQRPTGSAMASAIATTPTLQADLLGRRAPQGRLYTPRIYGFRVSEHAKSGPRMRWMRMRPESFDELDQGLVRAEGMAGSAAVPGEEASDDLDDDAKRRGPAALGVTAAGRSTATGRPMAGRATSQSVSAAGGQGDGT